MERFVRNRSDLFDKQFDAALCSIIRIDREDLEGTLREAAGVSAVPLHGAIAT